MNEENCIKLPSSGWKKFFIMTLVVVLQCKLLNVGVLFNCLTLF